MAIAQGTRIGRYEIRSKLGEGGMGEVYLADDTTLGRSVALKFLSADVAADQARMRRFGLEARSASGLNHPGILTIYEIGDSDHGQFIAAEFVDGETLRDCMRRAPLTLSHALDVAAQIASALAAAHAAGIIHRDIKPENAMIRRDGIVKVLDFGLAKLLEPAGVETATRTVATEAGLAVGTPMYMSPEQARGTAVDPRTDVFSLGVVLYEMVAGRLPFDGANGNERLASLLSDREAPPLARYARDIPAELERIAQKALHKDREQRYQHIGDLLLDLQGLKRRLAFETELERSGSREPAPASADTRRRMTPVVLGLGASLVAAALAYWAFAAFSPTASIDSIAVLPFENAGHDPRLDYLADGVTESLINSLSQLPNTRVIARSSVFDYKDQPVNVQQVAQRLNVKAVLTGRILEQGDTLDIRVELTDARNNAHMWGDHYARKAADIFSVQDEIATQVTETLRVRLTSGLQGQITKRYTANADAYRLYLQGRYYENAVSEENLNRAISSFDQAIALDPKYALAYAARAETIFIMGDLMLPMSEARPRVKRDIDAALALDENLAEARMILANLEFQFDWNFTDAERDFRRVIASAPNFAEARHQFFYYLAMMSRSDEAIAQQRLAAQLDPMNPSIVVDLSLPYYLARRYNEAAAEARKAAEMFPAFFLAHMALGSALVETGDAAGGVAELEQAWKLQPTPLVGSHLGYAYAKAGRVDDARRMLSTLTDESKQRYVPAYKIAILHAALGDKDKAFAWFEQAYRDRSWWLVWLNVDPMVDSLRTDSRLTELRRRVGLVARNGPSGENDGGEGLGGRVAHQRQAQVE